MRTSCVPMAPSPFNSRFSALRMTSIGFHSIVRNFAAPSVPCAHPLASQASPHDFTAALHKASVAYAPSIAPREAVQDGFRIARAFGPGGTSGAPMCCHSPYAHSAHASIGLSVRTITTNTGQRRAVTANVFTYNLARLAP
jgi:hypothetical protein